MKQLLLFFSLMGSSILLFSQADTFSQTISASDIRAHIGFLADDVLEGRETGERGQKVAAAYIQAHFKRLGLLPGNKEENSYQQTYYVNRTTLKKGKCFIGSKTFNYGSDYVNDRSPLPDELSGELVFAGYGISSEGYDNLEGVDLKDKIAVVLAGSPERIKGSKLDMLKSWRSRKDGIEDAGAKAMVMIVPDSMYSTFRRNARKTSFEVSISRGSRMPGIYLSQGMGKYLLKQMKGKPQKLMSTLRTVANPPSLKASQVSFRMVSEVDRKSVPAENVLGLLEGTDKMEEVIVLTAHYDHIGMSRKGEVNNGADDDGSGTATIMELAEAFVMAAKAGNRPRRSLLFMTVSGEEKGLWGSDIYTQHPIFPLEQTIANLNIDMIGRIDKKYAQREDSTNYVYIIGSDKLSTDLHFISEGVNQQKTNLTLDYTYNDENDPNRFYYRSDHYNFARRGVPVIFYFTGVHKDYHRPTDDIEKIRYEKTAKIGKLIFHTAWELANRAERIKVDKDG